MNKKNLTINDIKKIYEKEKLFFKHKFNVDGFEIDDDVAEEIIQDYYLDENFENYDIEERVNSFIEDQIEQLKTEIAGF